MSKKSKVYSLYYKYEDEGIWILHDDFVSIVAAKMEAAKMDHNCAYEIREKTETVVSRMPEPKRIWRDVKKS